MILKRYAWAVIIFCGFFSNVICMEKNERIVILEQSDLKNNQEVLWQLKFLKEMRDDKDKLINPASLLSIFLSNRKYDKDQIESLTSFFVRLLSGEEGSQDASFSSVDYVKKFVSGLSIQELYEFFDLLNSLEAPLSLLRSLEKIIIERSYEIVKKDPSILNKKMSEVDLLDNKIFNETFKKSYERGNFKISKGEHNINSFVKHSLVFNGLRDEIGFLRGSKTVVLVNKEHQEAVVFKKDGKSYLLRYFNFSPNEKYFLVGFINQYTRDYLLNIYDIDKGENNEITIKNVDPSSLYLSNDYVFFLSNGQIYIYKLDTGTFVKSIPLSSQKLGLIRQNDNFFMILNKSENGYSIEEVLDLENLRLIKKDNFLSGKKVQFLAGNMSFVLEEADDENSLNHVLDLKTGLKVDLPDNFILNDSFAYISPKGRYLFLGSENYFQCFDLTLKKIVFDMKNDEKLGDFVGFSSDERFFITRDNDKVFVWDIAKKDAKTDFLVLERTIPLSLNEQLVIGSYYLSFVNSLDEREFISLQSPFALNSLAQRLAMEILQNADAPIVVYESTWGGALMLSLPQEVRDYFMKKGTLKILKSMPLKDRDVEDKEVPIIK